MNRYALCALTCGVMFLQGLPALFAATGPGTIILAEPNVEIALSGRVRHETFNFTTPLIFRYDYFDRYTFQRARFNINVDVAFGKKAQIPSILDAHLGMLTFNVIDNYTGYTPIILEPIAFNSKNYVKKADIGEHSHKSTVTLFFFEDAYLDIKLERLMPTLWPIHFKIGSFSYLVGRGVALGDYYFNAVNYLGWEEKGNLGNTAQKPAGFAVTMGDEQSLALQFYYSKWKKYTQGPDHTRKATKANRLDRDHDLNDPRVIERGHNADRDVFAIKGILRSGGGPDDNYKAYIEPYVVYVNAPELKIEFDGDASARIGTAGCMLDLQYNGWSFNVEAAAQFGTQVVHPIDRNHIMYGDAYYKEATTVFGDNGAGVYDQPSESAIPGRFDKTMGTMAKYNSHILVGITTDEGYSLNSGEALPYRAYYVSDDFDHINAARAVNEQGQLIRYSAPINPDDSQIAGAYATSDQIPSPGFDQGHKGATGAIAEGFTPPSIYNPYYFISGIDAYDNLFSAVRVPPNGALYNSDIPFGAGQRFRPKYTLSMRGVMCMADLSYTFPDKYLTLSGAVGYAGGDQYPFDNPVDKTYRGFMPFRDANYKGVSVKSYAVLAARRIARPSTYATLLLYAPNNYESTTNLQYFGLNATFRPFKKRERLVWENNLLYFWEVVPPFVWDKNAVRDFGNDNYNGMWSVFQQNTHFTGYQTDIPASKQLGLEFNSVLTWTPVPSVEVHAMFALFVPGKLFVDIDGTPNEYAIRFDSRGDVHLDSLGNKMALGGFIRLTYYF